MTRLMRNPYLFLSQREPSHQGVGDPLLGNKMIPDMDYLKLENGTFLIKFMT